jgi:hypothetical protein
MYGKEKNMKILLDKSEAVGLQVNDQGPHV